MKQIVITGLCAALLVGCGQQVEKTKTAQAVEQAVKAEKVVEVADAKALVSGIDKNNFDTSVRPQDDFYQYVNGTWLKSAVIPSDRTSIGAFYKLREKSRDDVMKIIEDLSKSDNLKKGTDEQKVADLYLSFMNEDKLNALGLKPIAQDLAAIDALSDKKQLANHFGKMQTSGVGSPMVFYVEVDAKASTEYRAHFWQGGLSLPDKDYYLKDDQRSTELRTAYLKHVENMFSLAGFADPKGSANKILEMETAIANAHWSKTEVRDSEKRYNKYTVAQLALETTDKIDWQAFLSGFGVADQQQVIINQPSYVKALGEMIETTSMDDWKTYLKWNLLTSKASYLTTALDKENFDFFSKTLGGQTEQRARWKRGTSLVSSTLGEVIGKVYVARHFKPEAKSKMVELVENLRKAYGKGIDELEWMSVETKLAAKDKLAKFNPKVGYPDVWQDYSGLQIDKDDLIGNLKSASLDEHKKDIAKLGGAIDKTEWGMTPQTVNAYYHPTLNEIVFPAAILQPPFFNLEAEDAVNYGAIGAVIGHEMGHGFDDQGSRYDGDGNLRNWWTEEDLEEFKSRTGQLVEQFSNYKVFDDLNVNGELTLGENIGDLAGLTIAYKAYKLSLNGKESPVIDGLSGDQRFFMGFAQVWQKKQKEKALRMQVETDPHSPGNFRALGTLSNMPEFYEAFGVKKGDGMYIEPDKRVKIW